MLARTDRRRFVQRVSVVASALAIAACGGGGDSPSAPPPPPPLPPAPVITQQPVGASVVAGGATTLTVGVQDATGVAYQWSRNGAAIAGATQASYALPAVRYADGGRYAVQVTNAGGLVTSAEAVLTVTVPLGISVFVEYVGEEVLDMVIDSEGNTLVVVATQLANFTRELRVRKLGPTGERLPYGPDGQGLVVPGGVRPLSLQATPYSGIAFAPSGDVYVAISKSSSIGVNAFRIDGGTLLRFSPSGEMTTLIDWPSGSPGALAPAGLARGTDGTLYFVDRLSSRLMSWTAQAGLVAGPVFSWMGSTSLYATRQGRVAVDAANRVYALDATKLWRIVGNQAVAVYDVERNLQGMGALTLDSAGNVYVAENSIIQKVTPEGVVTRLAGQPGSTGLSTGALPGNLGRMLGSIAVGADGVIQVMTVPDGSQTAPVTLLKIRLQ